MQISKGDVAILQTSDSGSFWHESYMYKVSPGVRVVRNCLCVYGASVTFISTGYTYHKYDPRAGDWMIILVVVLVNVVKTDIQHLGPIRNTYWKHCVCLWWVAVPHYPQKYRGPRTRPRRRLTRNIRTRVGDSPLSQRSAIAKVAIAM